MTRKDKAMQSFKDGYNCAQCMVLAFEDMLTMDVDTALKLAAPFGGGMGRLREVCGSVSGMFMVFGYLKGYSHPDDYENKKDLYAHIQELARRFEEENGSIVCRELLGLEVKKENPTPEKRTDAYYKKRPCGELVGCATEILEAYLKEIAVEV